jgi:hypothetical protein
MQGSGEKIFVYSASGETKGVGITAAGTAEPPKVKNKVASCILQVAILVHSENVKLSESYPRSAGMISLGSESMGLPECLRRKPQKAEVRFVGVWFAVR